MSKFGWSYPPGAADDPYAPYNQSDPPCLVCEKEPDGCACPKCPECGEHGNPNCTINEPPITAHMAALALMNDLDADSLFEVYRDCGPSVGFLVSYTIEQDNGEFGPEGVADELVFKWVYGDSLIQCGEWIEPVYIDGVLQSGTATNSLTLRGSPYKLSREFFSPDEPCVRIHGVSVSSIVEGIDQCTDTIVLEDDKFTVDAFWHAVENVNQQAYDLWMETHGCEECSKLSNHIGLWHRHTEGCDGITPVHLDCSVCDGRGFPI